MDTSNKELVDAGFPVLLGVLFSIVRMLLERRKSVFAWVSGLFIGGTCAYLTHLYLLDFSTLSEGQKAVIIGLSGLLSHDIMKAALDIGRIVRENPAGVIQFIRTGVWPNEKETTRKNTETTTQSPSRRNEGRNETQQDD